MISIITDALGYSGSDPVVTYIVSAGCTALTICLAYKLLDFITSIISAAIGRKNNIKF